MTGGTLVGLYVVTVHKRSPLISRSASPTNNFPDSPFRHNYPVLGLVQTLVWEVVGLPRIWPKATEPCVDNGVYREATIRTKP